MRFVHQQNKEIGEEDSINYSNYINYYMPAIYKYLVKELNLTTLISKLVPITCLFGSLTFCRPQLQL